LTTAALLRSGDVIDGFRIDDVIGIGGMAIVYRAEQISLGRPVALKVLTSKLTRDEVFRERFRREGTHAAGLEHPNIVPVYDSGEQDGNLYIAMRLVEGTNLAELIQTRGLSADQTIEILSPIASALDAAHAAGLIHRDVKPQNILITVHGHPYLADFGVAKGSNTEGLTATGGFVGSIHYASPEQIKGLTLTSASDVYALTAVLYQCLTGHVPFPRETDAGVMHAQLHDPPPTLPSSSRADSDFYSVLARGMAKDSGARYGHAGDLINAAALCVSRLPTESRKAVPAFPEPAEPPVEALPASDTEIVAADEIAAVRIAASFTAADRRRPPAPEPPAQDAPTARMPKTLIAGIAAGLIAAALIIVLATAGSSGGHTSTFRSGDLVLSTGPGWKRSGVSVTGLPFAKPVAISATGTGVDAGALSKTAKIPGSLPPTLAAEYGNPAQASVITLLLGQAKSYTWPSTPHGALSLLMVATQRGEIAIACTTLAAAQFSSMQKACDAIRAAARIVGAQVEYPGPDPRVASELSRALADRAKAVAAASADMRGARLSSRAVALKTLAAKDEEAAHAVAGISAPSRDVASIAALAKGLGQEVALTRELSAAALQNSTALYELGRGRLMVARISAAGAGLAAAGFMGLSLPTIDIPRAPSRPHRRAAASAVAATSPAPVIAPQSSQSVDAAPTVSQPAYTAPPVPTPAPKEKEEVVISKPE
jgi:tRNA A-37 threonylcarbamoyl transferase component Bud32